MTIRDRLILWYSGLLAIIIVVFGTVLFGVTRWVLVSSVDNTLVQTADQVVFNSRAYMIPEFGSPSLRMELPELDIFRASGVVVQIWEYDDTNDAYRLVGKSTNLTDYQTPIDASALRIESSLFQPVNAPAINLYSNVLFERGNWRVLTRPIRIWGDAKIIIQSATPFESVNQASNGLVAIMVISMGVALLGSIGLGMMLSNRALAPINRITSAAANIVATQDLKTRLDWDGPLDELGRLTAVFNQMMERLEHLFSVQQRFVGDVSHELRTPLTAIQGHLELIQRYGVDADSLEAIDSEAKRMSRMVKDLLLLAKADYGGLSIERMPLDLDTLIMELLKDSKILAKDRDLSIKMGDFQPVRIEGDADRLKQLFLNLVSNAIKFTPDGGTITLNLRKSPTDAVIEVADTGIGIAQDDVKRIFDRFFQADSSRMRDTRTGEGVGLGLSIVKWIAAAHGGTIHVKSHLNKGTTFIVRIPHLDQPPPTSSSAVTRPRLTLPSGAVRRIRRGGNKG